MMHMNATDEKPTYVAIIISPPLTRLSSRPYAQPNRTAIGIAMHIAARTPRIPVSSSSTLVTAPSSPAMIPSGRPKFRPQPAWTIGTIASTMTPFIPNRTSVSLIDASTRTSTNGAMTKSPSRNNAMMIRGQPAASINDLIRPITPSPFHASSGPCRA